MFKTDNSLHVFVSNVDSDVSETIAASENNQICLLDKNGAAIAGAGDTNVIPEDTEMYVAMKDAAGNVRMSPTFKFKKANVKGLSYAARTEQTDTLTGISDVANTRYTLRLNFKHNVELFSEQSDLHFFEYVTGDSVSAGEVVDKFVAKINAQGGCKDKVTATKVGNTSFTIVGKAQDWSLGLHKYTMVLFDTTLDGFGAAAVATTGAVHGSGAGEEVAELEWFGVGSAGAPYRQGIPSNNHLVALNAVQASNYDIAVIDTPLADPAYAVSYAGAGRCQIVLAMATGATGAEIDEALGFTDDSLDVFS